MTGTKEIKSPSSTGMVPEKTIELVTPNVKFTDSPAATNALLPTRLINSCGTVGGDGGADGGDGGGVGGGGGRRGNPSGSVGGGDGGGIGSMRSVGMRSVGMRSMGVRSVRMWSVRMVQVAWC